jgi:hypothetical protein
MRPWPSVVIGGELASPIRHTQSDFHLDNDVRTNPLQPGKLLSVRLIVADIFSPASINGL